ncbi:MAG: tetratricopeptide repeat protein [Cyclobacteriaceae bacterium]
MKRLLCLYLCLCPSLLHAEGEEIFYTAPSSEMEDYIMSGDIEYISEQGDKAAIKSNSTDFERDNPEVARLKQKIESARKGENLKAEADALLALTKIYMSDGYPTGPGLLSLQRYHEVMKNMADEMGLGIAYRNSGVVFFREGDYERAMDYYLQATEIFENLNHKKESANMYYNIGLLFSKQGNERNAQEYYLKCLKVRENAGDNQGKASVYKALALLHRRAENYDISLSYYDKLITVSRTLGDHRKLASAYNNKGIVLKEARRYAESSSYYQLGLNQLREGHTGLHESELAADIYENLGILLRYEDRLDEAIAYYERALKVRNNLNDEEGIAGLYANMANMMWEKGALTDAIHLYEECEKLESSMGDRSSLVTTYSQLSSLYKENNNISKALAYQEKFTDLQMVLLKENRSVELLTMQHQYELQKKNREISRLDAENKIRQATLAKERSLRTSWLAGVLALIMLMLLSIAVFRHRSEVRKLKVLAGVEN